MSEAAAPILVPLASALGRPARFGPFPSGHEALKFAAVAAVGAVVADVTEPLLWLPFLGGGFLLAVVQLEGRSLDAHLADFARWRLRPTSRPARSGASGAGSGGPIARGPGGSRLAVLATSGIPVVFLPRREAAAIFDGFRALLRSHGHGLYLHIRTEPIDGSQFRPLAAAPVDATERAALRGYDELVHVLARRRRVRRVELVCWSLPGEPDGLTRLEDRVQALTGALLGLGLSVERQEGEALRTALDRIGWAAPRGPR